MQYLLKILLSAIIIASVSELAKKSSTSPSVSFGPSFAIFSAICLSQIFMKQ